MSYHTVEASIILFNFFPEKWLRGKNISKCTSRARSQLGNICTLLLNLCITHEVKWGQIQVRTENKTVSSSPGVSRYHFVGVARPWEENHNKPGASLNINVSVLLWERGRDTGRTHKGFYGDGTDWGAPIHRLHPPKHCDNLRVTWQDCPDSRSGPFLKQTNFVTSTFIHPFLLSFGVFFQAFRFLIRLAALSAAVGGAHTIQSTIFG